MEITRISDFGTWTAKRDDEACYTEPCYPSGSKVRQYAAMASSQPAPMLVGCSAHSAMQIYVAAAAKQAGVPGIIYTAARRQRTEATEYALEMGAEVCEVRPAYLSVCRARARNRAADLQHYIRWQPQMALEDTATQCVNIPIGTKRIVIPTGSGLTASGVLVGLARLSIDIPVMAVAVSNMATQEDIISTAQKSLPVMSILSQLHLTRVSMRYEDWQAAILPDGTPLDPYYSAKALPYLRPGDCLWLPGLRPLCAMPLACRHEIQRLQTEGMKQ